MPRFAVILLSVLACVAPAAAQQRPLVTEEPLTIGAGEVLVEIGADYGTGVEFPASGLKGDLWRGPLVGVSIGISSIAELQIDGGFYNRLSIDERRAAPLSGLVDATGDTTSDVEDIVVATKINVLRETEGRPALGVRFATRLPNAGNESGLGLDTTDFLATLLVGKTVQSIRVVGNVGLGILGNPIEGNAQNDVLLYGVSVARAFTDRAELVADLNGHVHTSSGEAAPGTDTRGSIRIGGRYSIGSAGRVDAGIIIGLTERDPGIGVTFGYTHVFKAFSL